MKFFRWLAVVVTQGPFLFFFGGKHDLLFGFNQSSAGFDTLIFLFLAVPVLDLVWLVLELKRCIKPAEGRKRAPAFLMAVVAGCFLAEALAIDLYILSHARM